MELDLDFDLDLVRDLDSLLSRPWRTRSRGVLRRTGEWLLECLEGDLRRLRLYLCGSGERDLSVEVYLARVSLRVVPSDSFLLLLSLMSLYGDRERLCSGDNWLCRGLRLRGGVRDLERDLVSDLGRYLRGGVRDGDLESRMGGRCGLSCLPRGSYLSFKAIGMRRSSSSICPRCGGGDLDERWRPKSRPPRPLLPRPLPRSPRSLCLRLFASLSLCRSSSRRRRAASAAFSASICELIRKSSSSTRSCRSPESAAYLFLNELQLFCFQKFLRHTLRIGLSTET